jgi:hypothetical protein
MLAEGTFATARDFRSGAISAEALETPPNNDVERVSDC